MIDGCGYRLLVEMIVSIVGVVGNGSDIDGSQSAVIELDLILIDS